MELHQLRYLRAIVRTGSVTAAAEAEHVAQPSVSKQIRQLERELGVPLLHRVGRRVVPTQAAIQLADCADRVFDDIATTTALVASGDAGVGASVKLCATETITNYLLPDALSELRTRHPNAHISVEMLGTDDSLRRVLADEVDFAIVVLPLADSRFDIHPLLEEEVLLAVPRDRPFAADTSVLLDVVLRQPDLLLSMPGHGLRAQIDGEALERGIELDAAIELRSQQALLGMVAAGGGVAFAPRIALEGRQDVAVVRTEPTIRRSVGWLRRRGRHLRPIASELLELLRQRGQAAAQER